MNFHSVHCVTLQSVLDGKLSGVDGMGMGLFMHHKALGR